MRIRSKQVLLDASVIITAHEIDVWNALLREVDVAVTSIIAHDESLFFSKEAQLVPAPSQGTRIHLQLIVSCSQKHQKQRSRTLVSGLKRLFSRSIHILLANGDNCWMDRLVEVRMAACQFMG